MGRDANEVWPAFNRWPLSGAFLDVDVGGRVADLRAWSLDLPVDGLAISLPNVLTPLQLLPQLPGSEPETC